MKVLERPHILEGKDAIRALANRPAPRRPAVPTAAQWAVATPREKAKNSAARLDYVAEHLAEVHYDAYTIAQTQLELTLKAARRGQAGHFGLVIGGPPGVGKTTLAQYLCLHTQRILQKNRKDPRTHTIYCTFVGASPEKMKGTVKQLARAAGVPENRLTKHDEESSITESAEGLLRGAQCSAAFIDECQNMNASEPRQVAFVKSLLNSTWVIPILAGENLYDEGRILHNLNSSIARRVVPIDLEPFALKPAFQLKRWEGVLKQIEADLPLVHAKENDLVKLAPYLWQRTRGFIGSLVYLIQVTAFHVIATGEERITKPYLDMQKVDVAAQRPWEKEVAEAAAKEKARAALADKKAKATA